MRANPVAVGEPAPWFTCRTPGNSRYVFDSVGGRFIVLSFFESAARADAAKLLDAVRSRRARFDDVNLAFFGVSCDPEDERSGRLRDEVPGIRYVYDLDRKVSGLYGAAPPGGAYRAVTYVIDPMLRVCAALVWRADDDSHVNTLIEMLDRIPRLPPAHTAIPQAPVLVLPYVFEPALCKALMEYYDARGGEESGFMLDDDGRTVKALDPEHKRRRDCVIEDPRLKHACMVRVRDRLLPEVQKAFQFRATRMERYIVGCYDAAEGGHFRAHRDNTTLGTAHRRFAVSVFLNSGGYQGGQLRFPEYGNALYSVPAGGAVVFSCGLLHEAMPVTQGKRYVFLPFLYDEEARRLREENLKYLQPDAPSEPEVAAEQQIAAEAESAA